MFQSHHHHVVQSDTKQQEWLQKIVPFLYFYMYTFPNIITCNFTTQLLPFLKYPTPQKKMILLLTSLSKLFPSRPTSGSEMFTITNYINPPKQSEDCICDIANFIGKLLWGLTWFVSKMCFVVFPLLPIWWSEDNAGWSQRIYSIIENSCS